MLTRLYIDNFRCFVDFEYRPGRTNLILGRNGSGKSSMLDALLAMFRLSWKWRGRASVKITGENA
jgi:AAA15 family ATPase/GTPase